MAIMGERDVKENMNLSLLRFFPPLKFVRAEKRMSVESYLGQRAIACEEEEEYCFYFYPRYNEPQLVAFLSALEFVKLIIGRMSKVLLSLEIRAIISIDYTTNLKLLLFLLPLSS